MPVYLSSYLAPFGEVLARPDVTDIYINRPQEIWVETLGGHIERLDAPALDTATLDRLARQIAALSHQGISREHPLLSATLPDGARVQIVVPPATRGATAMAIRKHVSSDLTLDDYVQKGAFAATSRGVIGEQTAIDRILAETLESGDIAATLATAVKNRKNILVSGGTSTGKTTFLNALLREIPPSERLILIEDTPELQLRHETRSVCWPHVARSTRRRSPPTACSQQACDCGPIGSSSASCAALKPIRFCAPSIPGILAR